MRLRAVFHYYLSSNSEFAKLGSEHSTQHKIRVSVTCQYSEQDPGEERGNQPSKLDINNKLGQTSMMVDAYCSDMIHCSKIRGKRFCQKVLLLERCGGIVGLSLPEFGSHTRLSGENSACMAREPKYRSAVNFDVPCTRTNYPRYNLHGRLAGIRFQFISTVHASLSEIPYI